MDDCECGDEDCASVGFCLNADHDSHDDGTTGQDAEATR